MILPIAAGATIPAWGAASVNPADASVRREGPCAPASAWPLATTAATAAPAEWRVVLARPVPLASAWRPVPGEPPYAVAGAGTPGPTPATVAGGGRACPDGVSSS